MTGNEYVERVRTASTHDEAFAVTREALDAARAQQISVDEWNAVWIAFDIRTQPERYRRNNWTGD